MTELGRARLSVVTIVYNDLQGLRRTMASLRRHDVAPLEHIVIDGASTDGSADWARDHHVVPRTVVVSEPDAGIYDAMNKGLARASGDLICFLNSGDRLTPDADLSRLVASHDRLRWLWCYGVAKFVSPGGLEVSRRPTGHGYSWTRQTFWRYEICHPAVLMETAMARRLGGYDTSYSIAADYRLFTLAGRQARPHRVNTVLAEVLAGGVSDQNFAASLRECHRARVEILGLNRLLAWLDSLWTDALIARTRLNRALRRRLARRTAPD